MNTTLHLFRDDVRRLRWWLLGWGLFWALMLVMSGGRQAGPADLSSVIANLASPALHPVLLANVVHVALLIVLVALLMLPHGPADPRLFWRTRPVEARDVLRAKALFIGLFLIAFPIGAEVVFWLGWLPVRDVLLLVPSMLGERLAWSAGVTVLVVLGERDARRYQLGVVGLLALGMVWTYAGDQFLYAYWEIQTDDTILPQLDTAGIGSQLWTFFSKGPNRAVGSPNWLAWIPAVTLGLGGWLVVGCRYLTQGWRATRITGLLMLLVALLAGHIGVRVEQRFADDERSTALAEGKPGQVLPMDAQAAALHVELKHLTNLGVDTNWNRAIDSGESRVPLVLLSPEWSVATPPPGMVALILLINLSPANLRDGPPNTDSYVIWENVDAMIFSTRTATNELTAALAALTGHRLAADGPSDYGHNMALDPKRAADLQRAPQPVNVEFHVGLVEVRTLATIPLRLGASGQAGKMQLDVRRSSNPDYGSLVRRLVMRQPYHARREVSFFEHGEPDLLIYRNRDMHFIPLGDFAKRDCGLPQTPGFSIGQGLSRNCPKVAAISGGAPERLVAREGESSAQPYTAIPRPKKPSRWGGTRL